MSAGVALQNTETGWRHLARTVPANRNPELRCDIQLFGTTQSRSTRSGNRPVETPLRVRCWRLGLPLEELFHRLEIPQAWLNRLDPDPVDIRKRQRSSRSCFRRLIFGQHCLHHSADICNLIRNHSFPGSPVCDSSSRPHTEMTSSDLLIGHSRQIDPRWLQCPQERCFNFAGMVAPVASLVETGLIRLEVREPNQARLEVRLQEIDHRFQVSPAKTLPEVSIIAQR
jgi:hypothetical protein